MFSFRQTTLDLQGKHEISGTEEGRKIFLTAHDLSVERIVLVAKSFSAFLAKRLKARLKLSLP